MPVVTVTKATRTMTEALNLTATLVSSGRVGSPYLGAVTQFSLLLDVIGNECDDAGIGMALVSAANL